MNMSRSKKKNMYHGITTAASEKEDKKIWHRIFRRKNTMVMMKVDENEDVIYPEIKESSDPWGMSKDGKRILYTEREIRKSIDAMIREFNKNVSMNKEITERYIMDYISYDLCDELCVFFKINKEEILKLSVEDSNKFIEYFLNKQKRK
jgi:hypothetical protein